MDYYFAYGSNMNINRMIERGVEFYDIIPSVLYNYELRFNKISKKQGAVANIVPKEGAVVEGVIYKIKDIRVLDKPEGYPNHYNRIELQIINIKAWVYIANPEYIVEGLRPKQEYLNHLLEGKNHLSEEYYNKLLKS